MYCSLLFYKKSLSYQLRGWKRNSESAQRKRNYLLTKKRYEEIIYKNFTYSTRVLISLLDLSTFSTPQLSSVEDERIGNATHSGEYCTCDG